MDEQQIRDDERLKLLRELRKEVLDEMRRVCPDTEPESPARCVAQVVTAAYHRERRRQGSAVQTSDPNSNRSRKARAYGYMSRIRQAATLEELSGIVDAAQADDAATAQLVSWATVRAAVINEVETAR